MARCVCRCTVNCRRYQTLLSSTRKCLGHNSPTNNICITCVSNGFSNPTKTDYVYQISTTASYRNELVLEQRYIYLHFIFSTVVGRQYEKMHTLNFHGEKQRFLGLNSDLRRPAFLKCVRRAHELTKF
jgi:hypothetical protein